MPNKLMKAWYALVTTVVATILGLLTFNHITDTPLIKDARQNTSAAYHLVHAGVISSDRKKVKVRLRKCDENRCPLL